MENVSKRFCIKLCSDVDFEGMVLDICFDDQPIAMVNYDKGINKIEIEVLSKRESSFNPIFYLQDFIDILEEAKILAIQCAEEDRLRNQE